MCDMFVGDGNILNHRTTLYSRFYYLNGRGEGVVMWQNCVFKNNECSYKNI